MSDTRIHKLFPKQRPDPSQLALNLVPCQSYYQHQWEDPIGANPADTTRQLDDTLQEMGPLEIFHQTLAIFLGYRASLSRGAGLDRLHPEVLGITLEDSLKFCPNEARLLNLSRIGDEWCYE